MGLGGTGGRAPDLELADKFQFQICPFSSLSLIHLTYKMQVAVTNALTVPSPLGRPTAPFPSGKPHANTRGGYWHSSRMGKVYFKRHHNREKRGPAC